MKSIHTTFPQCNGFPTPSHLDQIISTLKPFHPQAIYIFGSVAMGTARPQSDIDIAFLPPHPCDPLPIFDKSNQLADLLRRDVDLIDLRNASTVMAKEVIRTGKLIADANTRQRQEFEMRTLADYAQLNIDRRPILEKIGIRVP